jgi:hypothetical protein
MIFKFFSGAFAIALKGGSWDIFHVELGIQLMTVGAVTASGTSTESA